MSAPNLLAAVFLDKDGTILENVPYNVDPAKMRFSDKTPDGLRLLTQAGYRLFVISNQSGVARGLFPEEALLTVREQLEVMLRTEGIPLDDFYYCPHHPHGTVKAYSRNCFCRKPNPGLLLRAAREHHLDLASSWFIGDTLDDMECGRKALCSTVLIDNGNETERQPELFRSPHFTASNLLEAGQIVLKSASIPAM